MAKKPTKETKPPPTCKAILLCERTMVETGTNRISLVRLIHTLTLRALPAQSERMKIFLHLVAGFGDYDIMIEIHDLAEDRVIFRAYGPRIGFANRLSMVQLSITIPALPILHPGRYDVIVFGNGEEIDRQQFRVRSPNTGGAP